MAWRLAPTARGLPPPAPTRPHGWFGSRRSRSSEPRKNPAPANDPPSVNRDIACRLTRPRMPFLGHVAALRTQRLQGFRDLAGLDSRDMSARRPKIAGDPWSRGPAGIPGIVRSWPKSSVTPSTNGSRKRGDRSHSHSRTSKRSCDFTYGYARRATKTNCWITRGYFRRSEPPIAAPEEITCRACALRGSSPGRHIQ